MEGPKPKNRSVSFTICRSSMVNISFSKFIYNTSVTSLLSPCSILGICVRVFNL